MCVMFTASIGLDCSLAASIHLAMGREALESPGQDVPKLKTAEREFLRLTLMRREVETGLLPPPKFAPRGYLHPDRSSGLKAGKPIILRSRALDLTRPCLVTSIGIGQRSELSA